MPNTAPFNVVSGSGTIYEAPVGTTFPDVDVDPVAAWVKVGKTGDLDYTRDGITVVSSQTMNKFQSLGSTGTRKIFRASEDLMVMATLADMSPESLSGAFNHNPVDTSVSGQKSIGLSRGYTVTNKALLVRFDFSSEKADGASQYEIPITAQTGNPEVVARGGDEPMSYTLEWSGIIDASATDKTRELGQYIVEV